MDCQRVQDELGPYLDRELSVAQMGAFEAHFADCPSCAAELAGGKDLLSRFDSAAELELVPPADIWTSIQHRLTKQHRRQPSVILRFFHRPLALAASLAVLLGAGTFLAVTLNPAAKVAQADSIDYSLLLDGLAKDADASVNRFLDHYRATRMDAKIIAAQSAPMRFRIPEKLPGGFSLRESYRLQFGAKPGYAARYQQDSGEPIFVFFHTPVSKTTTGVHRDSHCSLAQGSHCVEVGPWQLIHYTDPTTCHCLLSRIPDEAQLRAILAAISPDLSAASQPAE